MALESTRRFILLALRPVAVPRYHGALPRRRSLLAAKWSLAINNIASIRAGGLRWPKVGDYVPEAIHSVDPRAQQLTRDNGK
jgi:hypothetical protein